MPLPREPLGANQARKLISEIIAGGEVVLWDHCKDELAKDDLDASDALNVLRAGRITEPAEQEGRPPRWRYRVHTERMCVVVQFESAAALSVVTAWRKKR